MKSNRPDRTQIRDVLMEIVMLSETSMINLFIGSIEDLNHLIHSNSKTVAEFLRRGCFGESVFSQEVKNVPWNGNDVEDIFFFSNTIILNQKEVGKMIRKS